MNDIRLGRPRALVVYESMFGCTEEVARAIADGLLEGGFTIRVVDVREAEPACEIGFDLLVVGAPTHAFSLSRPRTRQDAVRQGARRGAADAGLREWLHAMDDHDGRHRPAAAFDTRVAKVRRIPKAASTRAAHLLTRHGYRVITPAAPFLVEDVPGPLVPGEVDRARAWGRRVALGTRDRCQPGPTA